MSQKKKRSISRIQLLVSICDCEEWHFQRSCIQPTAALTLISTLKNSISGQYKKTNDLVSPTQVVFQTLLMTKKLNRRTLLIKHIYFWEISLLTPPRSTTIVLIWCCQKVAQSIQIDYYMQQQNLCSFNLCFSWFTKYVKLQDEKNLDNLRLVWPTSFDAWVRVMERVGEESWRPGMTSPPWPKPWCHVSHNKKAQVLYCLAW